jgi:hypothetical protein
MAGLAAGVAAGSKAPKDQTDYYFGRVGYFSPDGKTAYGWSVALIKREIMPARGKIVETALQPAKRRGKKPEESVTECVRAGSTSIFNVVDKGKTFSGTVTFIRGGTWAWTEWQYDITLASGGVIKGEGKLSTAGIRAKKTYTARDGQINIITEDLRPVNRDKYTELRRELMTKK